MFPLSFIDVGDPSPQRRRRNANHARSLVMIERRRAQRIAREAIEEARESRSNVPNRGLMEQMRSAIFLLQPWNVDLANDIFRSVLQQSMQYEGLSNSTVLDKEFVALQGYDKPVTRHMHMLINHAIQIMWPKYWPAKSPNEVSPLVKAWWPMFVNVSAVFHVFLYAAAVHYDDMMGRTSLSQSREILMHKDEALRQLRLAFENGPTCPLAVCDQVLLAMTYLGFESEDHDRDQVVESSGSFDPPDIVASAQWRKHYAYAKDNVHTRAATRLIKMKRGGLDLLSPALAKPVAINDLHIAAKYVRKPEFPFWDIPEIIEACRSPQVNVLWQHGIHQPIPFGFEQLVSLGLTRGALNILREARIISAKIDHYDQGHLETPEFHLLLCEKNQVHHDLLSLPTATELSLSGIENDIYDCCRIGALLFSTGVLFSLPPSTGAPQRLGAMARELVEQLGLEMCMTGGGKVLIWLLVLAAIIANDAIDRPWFLRRLKPLLAMEGINTWDRLKDLCSTFLWMDSACNAAAKTLYDGLSRIA